MNIAAITAETAAAEATPAQRAKTSYFREHPTNKLQYQGRRFRMRPIVDQGGYFAIAVKDADGAGEWVEIGTLNRWKGHVQHFSGKNVWSDLGSTEPWEYRAKTNAAGENQRDMSRGSKGAIVRKLLILAGLPEYVS